MYLLSSYIEKGLFSALSPLNGTTFEFGTACFALLIADLGWLDHVSTKPSSRLVRRLVAVVECCWQPASGA